MKISQLVFRLGHCLAECETKLLELGLESGIAGLCRSLSSTIQSCTYVPIESFEVVALGIAQAACPLYHEGLCDSLILEGLRDADLLEQHAELMRVIKDIRFFLAIERMAVDSDVASKTVQTAREINGTPGERELLALDNMIEQVACKLPSAMKAHALESKIKFLLALGVRPRAIVSRVAGALIN